MNKKSCHKETEIYSRVVGFYRPTKLWNKGKKDEFKAREEYSLKKVKLDTKSSTGNFQEAEIG